MPYPIQLKKVCSVLTAAWLVAALLAGCAAPAGPAPTPSPAPPTHVPSVALALARGGLGDKAFNDDAYAGLQRAQTELGLVVREVEFQEGDAQTGQVRQLAQQGYDLIIALGAENASAVKVVAAEFPEQRLAIVDTVVDAPNVTSVTFRELEGDFLAGVLSALLSPSGTVGFLGGADVTVIRRIEHGWRQGVLYANPQAQILVQYAAGKDDFSGFNKPEVGHDLTVQLYQQGAELVYAAAGKTGLGAIEAAHEQKRLIITTGSDQRWIAPEVVVTSRTKNMEYAVFSLAQELKAGTLKPGLRELDYRSNGIDLAPLDGGLVPAAVVDRFKAVQADLEAGTITVAPYTGP